MHGIKDHEIGHGEALVLFCQDTLQKDDERFVLHGTVELDDDTLWCARTEVRWQLALFERRLEHAIRTLA